MQRFFSPAAFVDACNATPVYDPQATLTLSGDAKIEALLLSRLHVSNPVKLSEVIAAIKNLIALQMPMINRILEIAAHAAANNRLSIYITGPNESLEWSTNADPKICRKGSYDDVHQLISIDGNHDDIIGTLIHELTHFAMRTIGGPCESSKSFRDNFDVECQNQPSFQHKRASEHWAFAALKELGCYPPGLDYVHFRNDELAAQLPKDIARRLAVYPTLSHADEFLSFLLQEFVAIALANDQGPAIYAIERITNGALKFITVKDDNNCFYQAVYHTLKHEASHARDIAAIDIDLLSAQRLRKKVADYLEQNRKLYRSNILENLGYVSANYQFTILGTPILNANRAEDAITRYIQSIRDGISVDNLQFMILMKILDRPIIELAENGIVNQQNSASGKPFKGTPIFVHRYRNHFDALVPTKQLTAESILSQLEELHRMQQPFHKKMQHANPDHQAIVRLNQAMILRKIFGNMPNLVTEFIKPISGIMEYFARGLYEQIPSLTDDQGYATLVSCRLKINNAYPRPSTLTK